MTAPAMPADAAAWVRANAWTQGMRSTFGDVPGHYLLCACQFGLTHYCRIGQHGRCHRATPQPSSETWVCDRAQHPCHFKKPFRHLSRTSATGPRKDRSAAVWLADRVCRWLCPCTCHEVGKQLSLWPPDLRPSPLVSEAV